MAWSWSRVPPVCPRPRPDIIGTAAPQAATIGANSRLTLSPTPPVECLSSTGPLRSASCHESTSPECVIAPVRATRSGGVMPRRKIAMANAPTWASLTDPSAIPATSSEIFSLDSSPPSRLRRISSAVSIVVSDPLDERRQQPGEVAGGPLRVDERLLVAERHIGHALGQIGDRRDRHHAQPAVAGHRGLVDRRHAPPGRAKSGGG